MSDIKNNFAVDLIAEGVKILKKSAAGEPLDDILDKNRDSRVNSALSDCIFNYFRRKAQIDYIIDSVLNGRKTKPKFKHIIIISYVQSIYQHGISREVSVDCAVSFAKKKYGSKIAGFINGTLRTLLKVNTDQLINTAPEHIKLNIPEQVFKRWKKYLKNDTIKEISASFSRKQNMTFRLTEKMGKLPEEILNECRAVNLPEWGKEYKFFEISNPKILFNTDLVRNGQVYIQDPSTVSPCSYYFHNSNNTVYDLCAAPGGKSLLLLEKMTDGVLAASDSSLRRQQRTYENLSKNEAEADVLICVSSLNAPAFKADSADFILLDVPCTNTGVIRRRPDVLWNFSEKKLKELTEKQKLILRNASELVKTGGHLVYSTCSIEPEENILQVKAFTENNNFSLIDSRQLFPCELHDGGFSALLKKNSN